MSTRLDELRQYTSNLADRHNEVKQAAQLARNTQSAQIASRLDNSLMDKATTRTPSITTAPRPGNVTESLFKTPNYVSNNAMNNMVGSALQERQNNQFDAIHTPSYISNNAMQEMVDRANAPKQSAAKTVFDVVDRGAGYFNQGIASTVDFVANALPRLEGAVFGAEPEATFTGQILKPVTDATGSFKDWVDQTVSNIDQRVQANTKDNKAASIAANLGSQVVAALPNAVLAFLSGGSSTAAQLSAQSTGVSGTVTSAATKALQNPLTGVSFAQTLGTGYDEAKSSGASDVEAMTAATLSSLFNAAIETSGGIETLPGEIRNTDLSTAQKALEWVKSALDEGKEEVVQGVITNLTNKGVFDADKPMYSATDENAVVNPTRMLQEFGSGAAVGGILGGDQLLGNALLTGRNRPTPTPPAEPAESVPIQAAPTVESVMPNLQQEAPAQPQIADITPKPLTESEAPARPQLKIEPVQAQEQATAQAQVVPDSQTQPNVETVEAVADQRKPAMGAIGDMGAKTSDFRREVKKSQTHGIDATEAMLGVPEEHRKEYVHDVITEQESQHNAKLRLEQDYEGEKEHLRNTLQWTGEEVDMAYRILEDLQADAMAAETEEAWDDYHEWRDILQRHEGSLGGGLQAIAKHARKTGSKIVQRASEAIATARSGTDRAGTMNTVAEYAQKYDTAIKKKDVDSLLQIIRDTSTTRKTGVLIGNKLSKSMNWALDRIAKYARAELDNPKSAETTYEVGRFYDFLEKFAASGIEAIATDKQKTSVGKAILTIRRNAMLSKAATIMRNLVGNNVFDPVDSVANNLSVPLDMLLSQFTGTRSVAIDKSWFSDAKRKGSLDGLAMAMLEIGLDVNADGVESKYETTGTRTFHMANGTFSKLMSLWEKYMGYALGATDEFQKGGIASEVQRGIDRLYEQGKIKDDTLRNAGEQTALYRTFQDESLPAKMTQGIRQVGNMAHIGDLGAGDVLIPFAQVPANLPARAVDYSPVGLARGVVKMAKVLVDAKKGTLTAAQQASAVKDIGRGITGSGMIAAAAALAAKGIIRVVNPGGEDEDRDKAASEKAQGLNGTQWNLSATIRAENGGTSKWLDGDVLMSIAFLDPINAMLTSGALIAEDYKEAQESGEHFGLGDVFKDSLSGAIQSFIDLPVMQTLRDVANAYQYSDADRPVEKIGDAALAMASSTLTSFIPNSLKGIAQGLDPYQRDLYSKDSLVGQTVDQIMGSIPGLRSKTPTKQEVYGNDLKNPDQPLNFLNANILPGAITKYTETDLQAALNALGSNSVYLSKNPPKTITVGDEKLKLTDEQQRQFMADRGDAYEAASAALENDETYQDFSKEWKLKAYGYAETYANETAKSGLNADYEPETWVTEVDASNPEKFAEAVIQKVVENAAGDKNNYENKYLGLEDLLDNKSIDDQMALACMSDSCYTAYTENCEKAGISVQQFLDAYGTAQASGESSAEKKQAALDYIKGLDIDAKQKGVLAQAVHEAIGSFIPQDTQLPDQWLLDIGDTNRIVQQMSSEQRQKYNTYIKGSSVETQDYLDMMEYYGSEAAKTKTDASGQPIEGHETRDYMEKYIRDLKVSDAEKGRLYCSLYAEKTCPKDLLVAALGVEGAEEYISDARKEGYEKYIKGSDIDILVYFDMVDYYNSSESDGTKGKDGKVIKGQSKQDKVLSWIASLNIPNKDKGRLFCSLYSYKNCPTDWR